MYYWTVQPTHGYSQKVSDGRFKTKKEAYESMRNSALYSMKCNTEYDDFFRQGEIISYVGYNPYSGQYIYKIMREGEE